MKVKSLFLHLIVFSLLWLTACSNEENVNGQEFPPSIPGAIKANETEYEMKIGNYRWERKQGLETQVVTTDAASPYQIAENLEAKVLKPKSQVTIEIGRDPHLNAYLWNENGREKEITLDGNQLTVPTNKGRYIYEVLAKWKNGEVSYTFVVEVD